MTISSSIANLVRESRAHSGFSQRQVAALAHTAQSVVGRIEAGLASPSFDTAQRLVNASGFELRVAATQVVLAEAGEFSSGGQGLGQKPESFEDCAVTETHRVLDELLVVAVVASQIGAKAVGDVLDAAANGWVIHHVDNRAV